MSNCPELQDDHKTYLFSKIYQFFNVYFITGPYDLLQYIEQIQTAFHNNRELRFKMFLNKLANWSPIHYFFQCIDNVFGQLGNGLT